MWKRAPFGFLLWITEINFEFVFDSISWISAHIVELYVRKLDRVRALT